MQAETGDYECKADSHCAIEEVMYEWLLQKDK